LIGFFKEIPGSCPFGNPPNIAGVHWVQLVLKIKIRFLDYTPEGLMGAPSVKDFLSEKLAHISLFLLNMVIFLIEVLTVFFITGDKHGDFRKVNKFCNYRALSPQHDTLIVLGDAGLNYFGDMRDNQLKNEVSKLPITLLCLHGNHEMRPESIASYAEKYWNSGIVYAESAYPSILFAKDGEIYELDGIKAITIGGAYSVDKFYRLERGYRWFEDEQPSDEIKKRVEHKLESVCWNIDTVLSHTCPLKYEPTEVFLKGIDQSTIDKSTEIWLDSIENKLAYNRWFCGHYHAEKHIEKLHFLYQSIQPFIWRGY
jgi:hypothetical protein